MLNEFLFTKIEAEDIGNIWFRQDGATCHTAETTLVFFIAFSKNKKLFGGPYSIYHDISKHFDINHHFVRELAHNEILSIKYKSIAEIAADIRYTMIKDCQYPNSMNGVR